MSVIGYALLKTKEPRTLPVTRASVRTFIVASIAGTVLIVCGLTWFVTRFEHILPVLVTPLIQASSISPFVYGPVLFLSVVALVLQWRRRQRSVLDLWLSVVNLAWLFGSITLIAIGGRYDVAWYAITAFSIVSATVVLLILLSESAVLHAQLAIAEVALRTFNETLEQRIQDETRERLQIWNVSQDLLVIAGLNGGVLSVNPAWTATLGWSEEDLLGESSEWLLHPDDRERTRAELDHLAQGHKTLGFENRLRAEDGSYHWISWQAAPDSGRIYSVGRDVTEQRRAEAELQQARTALAHRQRVSMLGEVAASLAHEIRQPSAAVQIDAVACHRALTDDRLDVQTAREAASRLVKEVIWADEIIKRTTALYKKETTRRERVNINALIREMAVLLQQEAKASSIRTDLADELPDIVADRIQLQQVLMNLMLNAIEAMTGTGGELTVTSQLSEDRELLIAVRDTGVGLPTENPEQIFESFVTTKPHGTGMGLTITRSIVESHGGRLWATANAGPGATFLFTLPSETRVPQRS
jgi:PAS domain S-box-containing protein